MPMTTANLPGAEPEQPKKASTKAAAKSGLEDAAASMDPAVVKLMLDRGARLEDDHPDAVAALAVIDDQLRELGYDF